MRGRLYGVGVGPGDPELMTMKAARVIREADVIAVPGRKKEETTAYRIAVQAVPEIRQKDCLEIEWPMTKDRKVLEEGYARAAGRVWEYLAAGQTVAFLTLGDPTVYSTYLYLHRLVIAQGGEAEIVSGVPSFCAAAARLNMGLVERNEPLHIIPASYQIEEALRLSGTKVLMKAGSRIKAVKEQLVQSGEHAVMVENCGMPDERCFYSAREIPEDAGYYSLMIVKDKCSEGTSKL